MQLEQVVARLGEFVSIDAAAGQLGVSRQAVEKAVSSGKLRAAEVAGRRVTHPEWLAAYREGRPVVEAPPLAVSPAPVAPPAPKPARIPQAADLDGVTGLRVARNPKSSSEVECRVKTVWKPEGKGMASRAPVQQSEDW